MITSTENSVSPPFRKMQKTICDKHGDQSADTLHQEEESKSHLSLEQSMASNHTPEKNIKTFVAQCAKCHKWRLISTKEKYEEIRERVEEDPFVCERAREWNPNVTCDDPSDVSQEDSGGKLWAIDKPGIPQAPPGWERFIKIRSEGKTQFADVHYKPPTGRNLRSLKDVEKYLADPKHADIVAQGVKVSQFSFEIPAPLQEDYVRKRSQKSQSDVSHTGTIELLQPEEVQSIDLEAASAMLLLLDPAQPIDSIAAALAQGDLGDNNNEDQPEVAQSEDLHEPPRMNADSTPHEPAV